MVYTQRVRSNYYNSGCICSAKTARKSKHQEDNDPLDGRFMAEYFDTQKNFCDRFLSPKKKIIMKKRQHHKSEQSLCHSTYSGSHSVCRSNPMLHSAKNAFLDCTNINYLNIPESDRRILEILTLKKEQEIYNENLAHQSQVLWEQSQHQRIKAESEQKQKWQKYVRDKRRNDSVQNLFRMEEIKQSLRESQKSLEDRLRRRDEQVALAKKKSEQRKRSGIKEKQLNTSLKKSIINTNFKHKEEEEGHFFQKHIEELEEKLNNAESLRRHKQQETHRRVASANRTEDLRHQENMLELLMEQSHTKQKKEKLCFERESRAKERQIHCRQKREKSARQLRAEQEERAEQVREMHRELTRGLEAWQDQVLLLQWADHQRAEAAVQSQREHRRLKLEVENKERQLLHEQRLKKVRAAELVKQQCVREMINAKEQRITSLQRQRERELIEGRAQAQMTAELREHLRKTLSPETFDRKVARATLETRIVNRPTTVSPSLMSSHIRLG